MPLLFSGLWFLLSEWLIVPLDILCGRQRRRYTFTYPVRAPKPLTWSIVSAHKIELQTTPPITLDTEPDPQRPGVYTGFCRTAAKNYVFAYRVLEEQPGEALSLEILTEESDPIYNFGDEYVGAVAVVGDENSSTVTATYDLTHTRLLTRFLMPLTLLRSSSSLKRTAEMRAGTLPSGMQSQIKNALITGGLTFASFFALFGVQAAAMLIALILIHELGHVVAMRWTGIPIRGIYFVPFFGGVAVGAGIAKSQAQRGLVAIMGPGMSIATTALFAMLSMSSESPTLRELAVMSAILNGFNLLPIYPLDGGQIAQALLARMGSGVVKSFNAAMLLAGGILAAWLGDYILLALLALVARSILTNRVASQTALRPLTAAEGIALALAYAASMAFYAAFIWRLWGKG